MRIEQPGEVGLVCGQLEGSVAGAEVKDGRARIGDGLANRHQVDRFLIRQQVALIGARNLAQNIFERRLLAAVLQARCGLPEKIVAQVQFETAGI